MAKPQFEGWSEAFNEKPKLRHQIWIDWSRGLIHLESMRVQDLGNGEEALSLFCQCTLRPLEPIFEEVIDT